MINVQCHKLQFIVDINATNWIDTAYWVQITFIAGGLILIYTLCERILSCWRLSRWVWAAGGHGRGRATCRKQQLETDLIKNRGGGGARRPLATLCIHSHTRLAREADVAGLSLASSLLLLTNTRDQRYFGCPWNYIWVCSLGVCVRRFGQSGICFVGVDYMRSARALIAALLLMSADDELAICILLCAGLHY